MNKKDAKPIYNLAEWLKIATNDLAAPAKTRICQEIRTHYEDAVQDHLETDFSQQEAEESALKQLGDPRVAGKCFRARHLTEKNVKLIEQQMFYARSGFMLVGIWIAFFGFCLSMNYDLAFRGLTATFLLVAVMQTANYFLAHKLHPRFLISQPLFCYLAVIILATTSSNGVFMFFGMSIGMSRHLLICFKVWRVKNVQQEMAFFPQDRAID